MISKVSYGKDLNFKSNLDGKLQFKVDLSRLTWLQTGGKADIFFIPDKLGDLKSFLKNLDIGTQIFVLGAGSNTLFRDLGYKGVVIKLSRNFEYIKIINNTEVKVGAATNCIKLARNLARKGAAGLEFLSGIPGTIGGAIKMNAGAYNQETSYFLRKIKTINRKGEVKYICPTDYKMKYRETSFPDEYIFLEATFEYKKNNDVEENLKKINELVLKRKLTQPITEKTSGWTFKNPKDLKAWKLIQKSGCKELRIGKASLSKLHSNFIINEGGATSKDIEKLGEKIREKVFQKLGINLDWEIRIIGE